MNKIVIFCQSYTQIKNALYLIMHNIDSRSVTLVIPGNHDLFKFFNLVNERILQDKVNIVYFERYLIPTSGDNRIKAILCLVPRIIKARQRLKLFYTKNLADLRDSEVFFFSRHWNDIVFYFLKRLSTTNRLVHIPDPAADALTIDRPSPANIRDLAKLFILKAIYGFSITIGKHAGRRIPGIPARFMEKEVDKVISREERDEMLRGLDLSKFRKLIDADYDIIYFSHNISPVLASRDTLERELTDIFNILVKHFPEDRIACKYHPELYNDKTLVKVGKTLPDFIPAEFLHSEKVKAYLSFWSLSIANVEKGLAISLIDIISFNDQEERRRLKESLVQRSHTQILFPKSLDEFERILTK